MINFNIVLNNNDLIDKYVDYADLGTLTFRNIEFDEQLLWKEDESLKYGSKSITQINSIQIDDSTIIKIVFKNCKFVHEFIIVNNSVFTIECNDCEFISSNNFAHSLLRYNDSNNKRVIFNRCDFKYFNIGDRYDIQNNLEAKICRFYLYGGTIENMTIQNIKLDSKLYFNRQDGDVENELSTKITTLIIQNTIFKENFKLHHCNIEKVTIKNTDFVKQADFYKSSFDNNTDIDFKALNFLGLTIFGHCRFTEKLIFTNVTFGNFVHFRNAIFNKGLDIDNVNIQKEINFLGVTGLDNVENQDNTSQETYRIIKYNFQKIGNQIEANKYHFLELNAHRQVTWKKLKKNFSFHVFYYETQELIKLLSEIVPSFIHWISSKYAQSWLLPVFWIMVVGWLSNCMISDAKDLFNFTEIFKYVSIINFDQKLKDSSVIFLFNKISLGYLYYQFVSALRKNTKK